ncbi:MAG: hypothetical protein JSV16_15625 [Candidatus Hydrogenedentota bacterium]|nr:MAG: hypothetical protein JSV16_15625 [Candidatus Hydrogenedentota bacterium]
MKKLDPDDIMLRVPTDEIKKVLYVGAGIMEFPPLREKESIKLDRTTLSCFADTYTH